MASDQERREAAERLLRARREAAAARSDNEEAAEEEAAEEEEGDLRERFPDPDAVRVPRGSALPEVPKVEFTRPTLPGPSPDASTRPLLGPLKGDLRGMGEASTIGMTLVFSIAIGAGLGALVDRFILKGSPTPWGLIVGFLMGTASGFINLVRVSNRLNEREERRGRSDQDAGK